MPASSAVGPARSVMDFIAASPSPYHAVATAAARLDTAGFARLDEAASWSGALGDPAYVVRGGAIVAWRPGFDRFRIVGAHTDSPNLRLKPRPDTGSVGWRQLAIEVYGGALVNSWLDRDLGLSGRVVLSDGSVRSVLVDRALARVPQLAIHLDRDVTERGLLLDRQAHLTPIWGLGRPRYGEFAEWLASEIDVDAGEIAAWDLMFHDMTPPGLLGVDQDLIVSARLDNQFSCACAIDALTRSQSGMVALFDHEEVGSASTTGAAGPLLEVTIDRLTGGGEARHRAMARSMCVSSDMAHAIHPNYPERHEPGHQPLPNGGPVVKINANGRYATDSTTAAAFTAACHAAGVPWQVFVSRNNMPCGSTIGPITATRLGIATVDVGCAQLSMHSARELAGVDDADYLVRALTAFFNT